MNAKLSLVDNQQQLAWLWAAVAFVAVPHVGHLAHSIMAYFAVLMAWHVAAWAYHAPLPRRPLLFALTVGGFALVLFQYHRIWGQEAGSSLFMIGLGLKLLETKTLRDAYLVIFLAFFVALTQYLFSQSIPMAGYTLIAVVLLVTAMVGLNSGPEFPARERLRLSVLMVVQALPIMLVLFVFFPRIQGPLWELPDDTRKGKSGLSETLSPGALSSLALSQDTAFRVDFASEPPPPKLRYWRGPVFWQTDGKAWSLLPAAPLAAGRSPHFSGGFYQYQITLEPHHQRWVFALDLPHSPPAGVQETTDFQLLDKEEITERKQFRLTSGTAYSTGALTEAERRRALQLPPNLGDGLKALVQSWQADNKNPEALAERALRHFREDQFFYTLNPPPLPDRTVERFLLETKRGFCEHYATAFVILMRIGGVPARVVTGYQGGQWNPIGRFLEVKQADAHAWAEIWLPERGWTRVDPTAAVAPERVERGVDVESQVAFGEIRFNLGEGMAADRAWLLKAWQQAKIMAASLDHAWANWVLAYGTDRQAQLFQSLNLLDWRRVAWLLAISLTVLITAVAAFILPKPKQHPDPAQRAYQQFLAKLAKLGVKPQTGEGFFNLAQRINQTLPDCAEPTTDIIRLYVRIRYEPAPSLADLRRFRVLVNRFTRPGWLGGLGGCGKTRPANGG